LAFRNLARGSRLLSGLLQTPVAIPHLAMAVFVINLIGQSGLAARMAYFIGLVRVPADFPVLVNDRYGAGIVICDALKETPFIALVTLAMLRQYITFPAIAPGLAVAAALSFLISWGQYLMTLWIGGGRVQTLPLILVVFQRGDQAITAALSLVFLAPALSSSRRSPVICDMKPRAPWRSSGMRKDRRNRLSHLANGFDLRLLSSLPAVERNRSAT
jgi:putative spermidine/putrescine transport system permease protein